MPKTIIVNSNSYVAGSGNRFVYNFPSEANFKPGAKIGLQSIAIYNSTFNISQELGNNKFSIIWNANTTTTVDVTIPDGYYSGSDLNYFLQSQFIANKFYVTIDNGTNFVYFAEILTNSVRYAFQINTYALPTSAQATSLGYSLPSGATWSFPTTAKSPQITINSGMGTLLGFTEQSTFPTLSTYTTSQQYLSNVSPIISPINSYLLTLNLLNSKYSIPNNIFYSIPLTVGFGSLITLSNSNIIFNDISAGRYKQIIITILDQNYNKVSLNDLEVVIVLAIIDDEN